MQKFLYIVIIIILISVIVLAIYAYNLSYMNSHTVTYSSLLNVSNFDNTVGGNWTMPYNDILDFKGSGWVGTGTWYFNGNENVSLSVYSYASSGPNQAYAYYSNLSNQIVNATSRYPNAWYSIRNKTAQGWEYTYYYANPVQFISFAQNGIIAVDGVYVLLIEWTNASSISLNQSRQLISTQFSRLNN